MIVLTTDLAAHVVAAWVALRAVLFVRCSLVCGRGPRRRAAKAGRAAEAGAPGSRTSPRPRNSSMVGGIKTHFVARGTSGRPIVFVHGFGSCTYSWRRNLEPLAAKGFRVFAIDVKGFGLTAKPRDGQYHLAAFTEHLLDFLDAKGIERPMLVGNSMGGAVDRPAGAAAPGAGRGDRPGRRRHRPTWP